MKRFFSTLCLFTVLSSPLLAQQPVNEDVRLVTPNLTLEGTLSLPANAARKIPVVLLIAGSGPTDRDGNNPLPPGVKAASYRLLADSLSALGVAVLRYDKRGVAKSRPADFSAMKEENMTFEASITDAMGWIEQLKEDKRFSKIFVAGHSEGSLVGMVAAQRAKANGYVSLSGLGRSSADALKEQLKNLPEPLRSTANADLDSLKSGLLVKSPPLALLSLFRPSVQPYLISWMKYDPATMLKAFRGPVLIIQGKQDFQVPVSEAELLKAARPDASLLLFDRMTHALKDLNGEGMDANIKTYQDPNQPLTAGLAKAIADFIRK